MSAVNCQCQRSSISQLILGANLIVFFIASQVYGSTESQAAKARSLITNLTILLLVAGQLGRSAQEFVQIGYVCPLVQGIVVTSQDSTEITFQADIGFIGAHPTTGIGRGVELKLSLEESSQAWCNFMVVQESQR